MQEPKVKLRSVLALAWALLSLLCGAGRLTAQPGQGAAGASKGSGSGPELRVEYFGAEPGYAVGKSSVVFLCVARNVGTARLPENTLRLRCYPMQGLELTESAFVTSVPRLEPNQAVALRWRLQPTGYGNHLVAAALLERQGAPGGAGNGLGSSARPLDPAASALSVNVPNVTLAVVPHFLATPAWSGKGEPTPAPRAGASGREALLANDRISVQVMAAESRLPVWALSAKDGTGWHLVAIGSALASVCYGEDGQQPWWQMFRWFDSRVRVEKDAATLTLQGAAGSRCNVELTLTARRDTGVIEGKLRLTAARTLRLTGIQFPSLLTFAYPPPAADGSALPIVTPLALIETDRLAAAHRGGVTFGLAWPSEPSPTGWHSMRLPAGDLDRTAALLARWSTEERGELLLPGGSIEFPFHLFAFGPSDTVRDAQRFALP